MGPPSTLRPAKGVFFYSIEKVPYFIFLPCLGFPLPGGNTRPPPALSRGMLARDPLPVHPPGFNKKPDPPPPPRGGLPDRLASARPWLQHVFETPQMVVLVMPFMANGDRTGTRKLQSQLGLG